jgi:hypothetical protein
MSIFKISLVAISCVAVAMGMECSKFDTNMGATFDLTDLVRYDCSWLHLQTNFTYFIRIGDEPSYVVTDGDLPCTTDVILLFVFIFGI